MKTSPIWLSILLFSFFLIILPQQYIFAQTADTAGIEFTEISEPAADTAVHASATLPKQPAVQAQPKDTKVRAVLNTEETAQQSLWAIFITGFVGGLAAILMPCIFPMLPLTVSFFTKGSEKGKA
ncbi:MAG: hypothetical protein ABWY16_06420, partial [Pedobacter sp.]